MTYERCTFVTTVNEKLVQGINEYISQKHIDNYGGVMIFFADHDLYVIHGISLSPLDFFHAVIT